ncbi:hypothetical protein [Sphingorhabdus sp. EL138]|jgi:hypothetical protein|uniref:hypothetical protein n=1 Tax=Sphingorhabdus sp. EL138 TaxID=2073156 RepID=UPI000D692AB5|nr:hypothetical protein [Sphingorhabdus sp. EL138]
MRSLFSLPLLAVSLSLSVPAAAQDEGAESEMIEKLNDPEFQDGMVSMMSGFMAAMMDLPIGQFAAAMEKAVPEDLDGGETFSDIDPDATLGELAARDNPDFNADMEDTMRKGTAMMGIMATEFGALLPQLKAMGEKMKQRMDALE